MARKIARKGTRIPPKDPEQMVNFQRDVNDDLLKYINELDQSTPDFRDTVEFSSDGSGRQRVAHGLSFVPQGIVRVRAFSDEGNPIQVWEYQEPDSKFVYVRTNAPQGAKIKITLSQV